MNLKHFSIFALASFGLVAPAFADNSEYYDTNTNSYYSSNNSYNNNYNSDSYTPSAPRANGFTAPFYRDYATQYGFSLYPGGEGEVKTADSKVNASFYSLGVEENIFFNFDTGVLDLAIGPRVSVDVALSQYKKTDLSLGKVTKANKFAIDFSAGLTGGVFFRPVTDGLQTYLKSNLSYGYLNWYASVGLGVRFSRFYIEAGYQYKKLKDHTDKGFGDVPVSGVYFNFGFHDFFGR